ncbi:MAG: hypothetical protein JXR94_02485 [Candidatus Hydrogenedentes bacterium]|nr:hypothetical protein [Candidatus Hydrogenedentota bacterium]
MKPNEEREQRWMKHLLGEASGEEAAPAEAEMREAPEEAAELKAFVERVAGWAREPIAHGALDADALAHAVAAGPKRSRWGRWAAWVPAAAATLLLVAALSQAQFTVRFGDAAFQWGDSGAAADDVARLTEEVGRLQEEMAAVIDVTNETALQVHRVAAQNSWLETRLRAAVTRLAQGQQAAVQACVHASMAGGD